MPRTRGRRPAGSNTREAIVAAAKHQFGEHGYPRTTLRGIAREAGVDTRLVTHYFGSKQNLFVTVVDFPFDPVALADAVLSEGSGRAGYRLAELTIRILEDPGTRQTMTGLVRAAASEDEAAGLVRRILTERMLTPLAELLGPDHPELRAALIGTQLSGYVFTRYVLGLPGIAEADPTELASAVGPVMQHYLTGPLGEPVPG
ncbi:TetR family transcriptional regulator [Phycicoccus sp.]|uniref:TetR/AcrR family transcriptional regulator n=1 Tax=Phycicoccus sp. TaxID=1902410 RepID=UPI002B6561C0|nr:TetR family transcriptional regulator [Phycicoccus sp.]HMM93698.1 TetR family transcriptional regulator [Phycicoccus sp.]